MNTAQLSVDGLERMGEYTCVYFEDKAYTNAHEMKRARAMTTVLEDAGVKPGDRVVVMMYSCLEVPAAFQAIWRLGAVIVPIMPQLTEREIAHIVGDSEAEIVLTSSELAPKVIKATKDIPGFRRVLACGQVEDRLADNILPHIESAPPSDKLVDRADHDMALLIYTSGTTGHPKGVMQSHANLIANAKGVASFFPDLPVDKRSLMALPMGHVYGIMMMNVGTLLGGVSILLKRFDAREALRSIEQYKIQRMDLVPTMLIKIIDCLETEPHDVSTLERVNTGSAPLSRAVRRDFERFFNCRLSEGYGQSECTCCVSTWNDTEPVIHGSVGHPIPGVEVVVMDEKNQQLRVGETGEFCFRGPSTMLGYWKNPEATAAAVVAGWLHSGDMGHLNEDGYLFITGRKKELIIKGGENISPREVEEALCSHPAVIEVVVFGISDPKYQENLVAAVVLKPGQNLTEEDLLEHSRDYITKFKLPAHVVFMEELPKSSVGKVLKRKLREDWDALHGGI